MKSSFIKNKPRKEFAHFSVHTGPSKERNIRTNWSTQEGQVWLEGESQQAKKPTNMDRVSAKKAKKIKTFPAQLCWLSARNCISAGFHKATGKDFVSPPPCSPFRDGRGMLHRSVQGYYPCKKVPPGYYANTTCAEIRECRNLKAGNLKLDSDISHGLWTRMAEHFKVSPSKPQPWFVPSWGHWGHIHFKLCHNRCWQDLTQLDLEDFSSVFIAFNLEIIPSALQVHLHFLLLFTELWYWFW